MSTMMLRWRPAGRRGFQRKWSIFQTRSFAASGPAAAPVASGSRFGASLSAHGQRLAEACVTLNKPVKNGMSLLSRPTALLRYFPRLAAGYQDKPAVNERAMSVTDNLTVADAWIGKGELNLHGSEWRRTPRARAEPGRVGVPLLTLLLSLRSESHRGP